MELATVLLIILFFMMFIFIVLGGVFMTMAIMVMAGVKKIISNIANFSKLILDPRTWR